MKMKCTGAIYVVGRGIVGENEIVDLDADAMKDPRIAAHFEPVQEDRQVGEDVSTPELPGMFDGETSHGNGGNGQDGERAKPRGRSRT